MEELNNDCIKNFDTRYSNGKIQCLKIISSHLTPNMQNLLAIYIKFLEIKLCLSRMDNRLNFQDLLQCKDKICIPDLIDELIPHLESDEQNKLRQLKTTLSQMEHLQSLFSTFQMMQEIMGDEKDNPFRAFSSDMDLSQFSSMMELFQNLDI